MKRLGSIKARARGLQARVWLELGKYRLVSITTLPLKTPTKSRRKKKSKSRQSKKGGKSGTQEVAPAANTTVNTSHTTKSRESLPAAAMGSSSNRRLSRCCLCASVRTGTIILAVLGLAAAGLRLLSYSGAAASGDAGRAPFDRMLYGWDAEFRQWRERGEISRQDLEYLEAALRRLQGAYPYLVAAEIACAALCLAKHGLLLAGVLWRRAALFLPYLVLGLLGLLFGAALLAFLTFLVFLYTTAGVGLAVAALSSLAVSVGFYLWHVVFSHYLEVKEGIDHDRWGDIYYAQDQEHRHVSVITSLSFATGFPSWCRSSPLPART